MSTLEIVSWLTLAAACFGVARLWHYGSIARDLTHALRNKVRSVDALFLGMAGPYADAWTESAAQKAREELLQENEVL